MRKKLKVSGILVIELVLIGILDSCANPKWTEAQKAQLSGVSLKETAVADSAYHEPDGTDSPGMGGKMPMAAGGGALPALIGAAIDAGVTKVQQSKFEKANAMYAEAAKKNIPGGLEKRFSQKLQADLKQDSFFNSRLAKGGSASIQPTMLRYGYKRFSMAEDGETLMSPSIQIQISVTGVDGRSLMKEVVTSDGSHAIPMKAYATDAAMTRRAFEKELDSLIENLDRVWDRKLGR